MHPQLLLCTPVVFAMPNPQGINGTAPKNSPSDDVLMEALLKYTRQGQSRDDQLTSLRKDFGYDLSLSALRKEKIRLKIPTIRTQKLTVDELTQAVIDEVEKDITMSRGPDFIKDQLRLKMVLAPRDSIRRIMIQYFPDGFDSHFPGRKGRRVARVPLRAHGPYFEDKYTDFVLLLKVYPDVRTSGAGGHIFLDFVEETGYIPIQLKTDKGSEIGWAYAFMSVLREIYAPDINPTLFPFHVMIKSVHNTVIEGFWQQFKEKSGLNLKNFLLRGKEGHLFNPHDPLHEVDLDDRLRPKVPAGKPWARRGHFPVSASPGNDRFFIYGNPAIPRVDLDDRLRLKVPAGKPWARRGHFPVSASPGNDRFFRNLPIRHHKIPKYIIEDVKDFVWLSRAKSP
ncbi:hypothetical protein B0H11DRAFT_2204319 [Mycena galericulata]|nr:hypothetical protein B0H11DRAFT_2204319 [Mycena galericulata]